MHPAAAKVAIRVEKRVAVLRGLITITLIINRLGARGGD
jgi:hypothetical protein